MHFQPRRMGSLAWAASGAVALCLSAASVFAQSESDDQWTPAPSAAHSRPAGNDGWNAREEMRENEENDPSGGADNGHRPATNSAGSAASGNGSGRSYNTYTGEQDRTVGPPRAGSSSYAEQHAASPAQRPTSQSSQQTGLFGHNDSVHSAYAAPTDQYGRPLRAGYQSSNQQSTYQQGNPSQPRPSGNRVNNYSRGSSDQDRNAYYGYRGPNGRTAMVDSGNQPHLATPNGVPGSMEPMPRGPMSQGMGPATSGEHVMGEEWEEGEPGGESGGPGCGCGEGGQCNAGGCCGWRSGGGWCGGACGGGCGNGCGGCNGCCCGPICQIIHCAMCGDWFHDFTAQVGVTSFREPLDVAFNGTKGNFGFDEGFNWGIPLADGFAGQAGMNFVQSDLTTGDFSDRSQIFFTGGLFYRNLCECGFQGGLVYDFLRDNWNGVDAGFDLDQLRGNVSYVMGQNEFGFWFTAGVNESHATINTTFEGQPGFVASGSAIKPADVYALYYRRHFCDGGEARFWGGIANQLGAVVGADMSMPLGDSFSIEGGFEYLIPRSSSDGATNAMDSSNEAWNIGINLVWHPNCHAHDSYCSCSRPLFDVADNSTFLMRTRLTPND